MGCHSYPFFKVGIFQSRGADEIAEMYKTMGMVQPKVEGSTKSRIGIELGSDVSSVQGSYPSRHSSIIYTVTAKTIDALCLEAIA